MIDKEKEIFNAVASALRKKYKGIYVIGTEALTNPSKFPAVSFTQTNSAIRENYSTFSTLENVVQEDYKAEVISNLLEGKEAQCKEITATISDIMTGFGYVRIFSEPLVNADPTKARRISRYRKSNVI